MRDAISGQRNQLHVSGAAATPTAAAAAAAACAATASVAENAAETRT